MKKLLVLLFAASTILATSCKKDTETTPTSKAPVTNVGKKDIETYD